MPCRPAASARWKRRWRWPPPTGACARGELLGGLADGWHRLGDDDRARGYLTRIVAELPGSSYADAAKKWLEHTPMRGGPGLTCLGCHE